MEENLQKFLFNIKNFIESYKGFEGRIFCIKMNNKLVILRGVIFPLGIPIKNKKKSKIIADTDNFRIIKFYFDTINFDQYLNNLSNGIIKIGNDEYYMYLSNQEIHTKINFRLDKYEREYAIKFHDIDSSFFQLKIYGQKEDHILTNDFLMKILKDLPTNSEPFEDYRDMANNFLFEKVEYQLTGDVQPTITAFAPMFCIIDINETYFDQNKLKIKIVFHESLNKSKIKCGLIHFRNNGIIERKTLKFNKSIIKMKNKYNYIEETISKVQNIISSKALLHYDNEIVDKINIYNPDFKTDNSKIILHKCFDHNLNKLELFLRGEGRESGKDFEIGILFLLIFLNYSTVHYGRYTKPFEISDEIDVIAIDDDNKKIIAAECTIMEINKNDKLNKLIRKVHKLKQRLSNYEFLPVIFTVFKYEEIPPEELNIAAENNIAIASIESIELFLNWAKQKVKKEYFYDELKKLIPQKIPNRRSTW